MGIRLLLTATLGIAFGTTSALADGCDDVYKDNVRTRTFNENNWASLNTVYDQVCTKSGETQNLSWDSSMGIVIDDLPIQMTGNGKSTSEKASSFCHNYHSLRFDASHVVVQNDEVVVAALQSYNACKAILARSGVEVTNKFADPDSIVVNFDFKNTSTVLSIQGVLAHNMTCRSNGAPSGQEMLNQKSKFDMRANFSVTCSRSGTPKPDGSGTSYLPGSLAIGTNLGSYTLGVTADTLYNNNLASAATAKIAGLQASLDTVSAQSVKLTALENRVNKMTVTATIANIGQFNPGGGMFGGCGTNIDTLVAQFCQKSTNTFKTRISNVGGGQCGYDKWIIACANY